MNIDHLLDKLDDEQIQEFAESYCDWYDADYYDDCLYDDETDEYYTEDDYSIVDSAMDAIRAWAMDSEKIGILEYYVANLI